MITHSSTEYIGHGAPYQCERQKWGQGYILKRLGMNVVWERKWLKSITKMRHTDIVTVIGEL